MYHIFKFALAFTKGILAHQCVLEVTLGLGTLSRRRHRQQGWWPVRTLTEPVRKLKDRPALGQKSSLSGSRHAT